MRKILMVGASVFSLWTAQASAATWEYAFYINVEGIGEVWETPGTSVTGKDFTTLLKGMQCDKTGLIGLMNCAGNQGWEFVQYTQEATPLKITRYIFKRIKS